MVPATVRRSRPGDRQQEEGAIAWGLCFSRPPEGPCCCRSVNTQPDPSCCFSHFSGLGNRMKSTLYGEGKQLWSATQESTAISARSPILTGWRGRSLMTTASKGFSTMPSCPPMSTKWLRGISRSGSTRPTAKRQARVPRPQPGAPTPPLREKRPPGNQVTPSARTWLSGTFLSANPKGRAPRRTG